MSLSPVATVYSEAFFNVVHANGHAHQAFEELSLLLERINAVQQTEAFLKHPKVPLAKKEKALDVIFKAHQVSRTTQNFCRLLLHQGRFEYLAPITEHFEELMLSAEGKVKSFITTAKPLSEDEAEKLAGELQTKLGQQVQLKFEVDPDLIGGIVARIGDRVYDGSIKKQIEQIVEALSRVEQP